MTAMFAAIQNFELYYTTMNILEMNLGKPREFPDICDVNNSPAKRRSCD